MPSHGMISSATNKRSGVVTASVGVGRPGVVPSLPYPSINKKLQKKKSDQTVLLKKKDEGMPSFEKLAMN